MFDNEPGYERDYWQEYKDDQAMGPPKEEPDCTTCGDSGQVMLDDNDDVVDGYSDDERFGTVREGGCPSCNPSPRVAPIYDARAGAYQAKFEADVAAGLIVVSDESPF